MTRLVTWTTLLVVAAASGTAAQRNSPPSVPDMLSRVSARIEQYYERAQSIMCLETVRLQPLGTDLTPEGRARRLEYELRVAWERAEATATREAHVLRQILKVDGRAPRPGDEPGCMDPRPVSLEPLAMLLPGQRDDYEFSWAGLERSERGDRLRIDYKSTVKGPADITWKGECVSISLPGRTRGRVWVDAATADVVRLDERLVGSFEFPVPRNQWRSGADRSLVIERADSSIRYRPVTFSDPDETVMLPESIDTIAVIRGAGVPRFRTVQTFSGCRRFLTGARIVEPPPDGR